VRKCSSVIAHRAAKFAGRCNSGPPDVGLYGRQAKGRVGRAVAHAVQRFFVWRKLGEAGNRTGAESPRYPELPALGFALRRDRGRQGDTLGSRERSPEGQFDVGFLRM
jgi:hypothetical protein